MVLKLYSNYMKNIVMILFLITILISGCINQKKEQPSTVTPVKIIRSWHPVTSFSGIESKTTDSFYIQGDKWKMNWKINPEPKKVENAKFTISVYRENEYIGSFDAPIDAESETCMGCPKDSFTFDEGNKNYYLDIAAINIESWSINIESLY